MQGINTLEGNFQDTSGKYVILASRFNGFIVESLIKGAVDCLQRHGVAAGQITLVWVPGAFEMTLTAKRLGQSKNWDAIIALGAVIRGATPHFDIVAGESAKGLSAVGQECDLPVINGVLTTDTIEQAIERAGTKAGNKGADAASAAMEMVSLLKQIK